MNRTMTRLGALAVVLGAGLLGSCEKNRVQDITGPFPSARVKFFNFGVGAPGVNFYANSTKMTAILSGTGTESTTGVVYGGAGAGGFYIAIAPGTYALTGRIAAATDKDLPIATVNSNIADGTSYSFYMSGIYDAVAKTVDAFVVEDPVAPPTDYTVAYVRFVHAISNGNPMTLYAKSTTDTTLAEVAVGGVVAYKGAGAFTTLPAGVYNLGARYTGVGTNAVSRTGVSFVGGRVYTIGARGNITVTSGTNAPALDNTANR